MPNKTQHVSIDAILIAVYLFCYITMACNGFIYKCNVSPLLYFIMRTIFHNPSCFTYLAFLNPYFFNPFFYFYSDFQTINQSVSTTCFYDYLAISEYKEFA